MAGFDPLDWLITLNVERARRVAYVALLYGSLSLVLLGYWVSRVPWQVSSASPSTIAEGAECGLSGAVYFIRVDGRRYECGGGDDKCPTFEAGPVSYDQSDPSQCRLTKNVRRLSGGQLSITLLGVLMLPYCVAFRIWDSSWAMRGELGPLSLAYRLSRAFFFVSIACYAALLLWSVVRGTA